MNRLDSIKWFESFLYFRFIPHFPFYLSHANQSLDFFVRSLLSFTDTIVWDSIPSYIVIYQVVYLQFVAVWKPIVVHTVGG